MRGKGKKEERYYKTNGTLAAMKLLESGELWK